MPTSARIADVLSLTRSLQIPALRRGLKNPPAADAADIDLQLLEGIASTFDSSLSAAQDDKNLSPTGKAAAGKLAGERALTALDGWITTKIGNLQKNADQIAAKLFATPKPAGDVAGQIIAEMRAREIREQLRGLDRVVRDAIYVSTDDAAVMAALEAGPLMLARLTSDALPVWEPMVSAERVEARQTARAEARDAAAAASLSDLRLLIRVYVGAADTLRTSLFETVPSLREAAAGSIL